MSNNIIRFGKHKGKTVDEIRRVDPDYLTWLVGQPWFKSNNITLYQTIINYHGDKEAPTPEHNRIHMKFNRDAYCLTFARHVFNFDAAFAERQKRELERACKERAEIEQKIAELTKQIAEHARDPAWQKEYMKWNRDHEQQQLSKAQQSLPALNARIALIPTCKPRLAVRAMMFNPPNRGGHPYDVALSISMCAEPECIYLNTDVDFAIEIKPIIGDELLMVLDQMRASGARHLLVGEYIGEGATREDFLTTFRRDGITVVFTADLDVS